MQAPSDFSIEDHVSESFIRIDEGIHGMIQSFESKSSKNLHIPIRSFVLLSCIEGEISYHNSEIPRTLNLEENEKLVFPNVFASLSKFVCTI